MANDTQYISDNLDNEIFGICKKRFFWKKKVATKLFESNKTQTNKKTNFFFDRTPVLINYFWLIFSQFQIRQKSFLEFADFINTSEKWIRSCYSLSFFVINNLIHRLRIIKCNFSRLERFLPFINTELLLI